MSKYAAKIENGTVTQVIRGDAAWAADRLGGDWKPSDDKVGQGWTWDDTHGFRTPKPYPSWTWSADGWTAPVANPGGNVIWDEDAQQWVAAEEFGS